MRHMRQLSGFSALALCAALVLAPMPPLHADGGDFQLDFVASAPETCDHEFGGGAYDLRVIGVDKDVVESLEGGDFACGDIVSFLTQIRVDAGAVGTQTIEIDYYLQATKLAGSVTFSLARCDW